MVNPIIPVATLIARLNAVRGKASKLNKELVTESMKPRTRKMKEKELRETVEKAKDLEKQIPPDTPGFAMGGGVMQRSPRVTRGLTNLLNKYNTSGPLAGAGNVPRGTMPVRMNQGGDPEESAPSISTQAYPSFPQQTPVYTPPPATQMPVPEDPVFNPPPVSTTPTAPTPGMLSDAAVNFDISDKITPQTEGYATTRNMNIARTGDPFSDAVEGEYQMPIYKPQATQMPFLSVRYGQPETSSGQPPPPPRSDQYSTGSFGRSVYADELANWERKYGPVAEYQAPDTEAVMDDTPSASALTGTPASSGTNFYPEPPPVRRSGGIGPSNLYRNQLEAWEQKYGPVEDYYAAQEAAQNDFINVYLSRQGEEAVANSMGYSVEELRLVNEDRRKQGLPPLGGLNQFSDINVNPGGM